MKLRRLTYVLASAALSVSSLFVLVSPVAHAASVAWDGGGADNKFSTAANWAGDALPTASDVLVFDNTLLTQATALENDISNASFAGITSNGAHGHSDPGVYTISGLSMTLTGNISGDGYISVNTDIILGADISIATTVTSLFSTVLSVASANDINLSGHKLTVNGSVTLGSLSGSGTLDASGDGTILQLKKSSSFTGSINVTGSGSFGSGILVYKSDGLGNAANRVTLSGNVGLGFCGLGGAIVPNPIDANIDSQGVSDGVLGGYDCTIFDSGILKTPVYDPTQSVGLSGTITLASDLSVTGDGDVNITGTIIGKHSIVVNQYYFLGTLTINSSSNASLTPNGQYKIGDNAIDISGIAASSDLAATTGIILFVAEGAERGAITVNGGTLKGMGTVGAVSMSSGHLAPGMSPGVLNSGNFTATGGNYDVEIGGTGAGQYDQLNVTGTVALGSATTLNVSHWNNFAPALNDSFVIINNDGADAVTGTFVGLADGASLTVGGVTYMINYSAGDGNDVALTVTGLTAEAAAAAAEAAAAPNTGFELLNNHAMLSIIFTLITVTGIAFVARKQITSSK